MADISKHLFVVILAGGGGTRLWPRSTNAKPKQFLRLFSDKTLIQETYDRIASMVPPERVIVVTNKHYRDETQNDLPEIPSENIIAEPVKRDSAIAMGVGAMIASKLDPEAVIVNLASDHIVQDLPEFHKTLRVAVAAAQLGDYLVTIGIHPTFPHTGFGYIKIRNQFKRVNGYHVFTVDGFTEKPKLARARAFLATGKYFWNANNYVWTANAALAAFEKHLSRTYLALQTIGSAFGTRQFADVLKSTYQDIESISIDYGISEKAQNLLLVPGDFEWNDVGDWNVVYELAKKDAANNVMDQSRNALPLLLDVSGCYMSGGKKLLAVVGLKDLVIVETKKALLIVPRDRAQEVKQVVAELKTRGLHEYL